MAITITWTPTGESTTTLTVNDDAQASLESYRLSQTTKQQTTLDTGQVVYADVPTYPNLLTMLLAAVGSQMINPAFAAFPPPVIATAVAAAATAQQAAQEFTATAILIG